MPDLQVQLFADAELPTYCLIGTTLETPSNLSHTAIINNKLFAAQDIYWINFSSNECVSRETENSAFGVSEVKILIRLNSVFLLLVALRTESHANNCNNSSVIIIGPQNKQSSVTRLTYFHFLFFSQSTLDDNWLYSKRLLRSAPYSCCAMLHYSSQKRGCNITTVCEAFQHMNASQQMIIFVLDTRKHHPLFGRIRAYSYPWICKLKY
jgi:hypothetical protein